MKKKYIIDIDNKQKIDNEVECYELTTTGTYSERNGKRYIVYHHYDDENSNEQLSTLKIDYTTENKMISLIRKNEGSQMATNLLLEEGKRHICEYCTPVGAITMGIYTKSITDELNENGGTLRLVYTIDLNGNLASTNSITILVRESQE